MRRKIFVSSVMRDFMEYRQAAKSAVETLRHEAIMAEDFGAVSASPQAACIEGVRQSEVYVGVFGERYGDRAESGLSPTEEEFREAQRRGIDVLCFVSKGQLDTGQKQFIDSIKGYETGQMLAFFETPEELSNLVIRALNDLSLASSQDILSDRAAQERFTKRFRDEGSYRSGSPKLRLALMPEKQSEEYIPPPQLGVEEFREKLQQDLLFGSKPQLFAVEKGIQVSDGEDFIRLWQGEDEQTYDTEVSIYCDAAIMLEDNLREPRTNPYSLTRGFVVDESKIRQLLVSYLLFSERTYASLASCKHLSAFFFWMQLVGMKDKKLGQIPNPEPQSIQLGGGSLGDISSIPSEPQRIAVSQLRDSEAFADNVMTRVIRKFRAAGGYFESL